VEAVSVCTPPSTHEAVAVYALQRHIHVLCEKPLAHTLESGQRLAEVALKSNGLFMTAFRHRYVPAIAKVKELIDAGRIGELVFVNNIFCGPALGMKDRWFSKKAIAGGGTMMDTSSHSVDIFRFLAGEIVQHRAVTNRTMPSIDVEDTSILTVQSESGVLGSLTASWVAGESVAVLDVMGQKGRITFDYRKGTEVGLKVAGAADWERIPVESTLGFAEEVAHFLDAIRTKRAPDCSVHDGFRALEIIQRSYGS